MTHTFVWWLLLISCLHLNVLRVFHVKHWRAIETQARRSAFPSEGRPRSYTTFHFAVKCFSFDALLFVPIVCPDSGNSNDFF